MFRSYLSPRDTYLTEIYDSNSKRLTGSLGAGKINYAENENGLNPYTYLTYIFKSAPNRDIRNNPKALRKLISDSVPVWCKAGAGD